MTIVVEDGTGLDDANSYASEDDFDNYVDDHGYTVGGSDTESALIRATQDLDAIYRWHYPGTRTNGREQALEWPRAGATDIAGNAITNDEVPIEVKYATIELAIRERTAPGSVLPDLERGGAIRAVSAGSVSVTYGANASSTTVLQLVNGIMSPLTGGFGQSTLFGTVTRG